MPRGKFTLFHVRGIPIGVDWSWFFVLFLVIWLLSGYYRDLFGEGQDSLGPYALAVVSAFGFFASIVLHELGHAIVAMRNGIGISEITLWMFGGIAGLKKDSESPGVEFRIAIAGPAVTLLIAAVCLGAGSAIAGGSFWDVTTFDAGVERPDLLAERVDALPHPGHLGRHLRHVLVELEQVVAHLRQDLNRPRDHA